MMKVYRKRVPVSQKLKITTDLEIKGEVTLTKKEIETAKKSAKRILDWAKETYPIFLSQNKPLLMKSWVFRSAVFSLSGWRYFPHHGEDAFIPAQLVFDTYPFIPKPIPRSGIIKINEFYNPHVAVSAQSIKTLSNYYILLPDPAIADSPRPFSGSHFVFPPEVIPYILKALRGVVDEHGRVRPKV